MPRFDASTDDRALLQAGADELEALAGKECRVAFDPRTAYQLAILIQTALHHPSIGPAWRVGGESVITVIRAAFADCPAILEILRRSGDPRYDTPARRPSAIARLVARLVHWKG